MISVRATDDATNTIAKPSMTAYSSGNWFQLRGEERADDLAQVGRDDEREEHGPEAQQPADRPLHEAEHEHAEQEQQEQEIEPVEVENCIPDVHAVSSGVTEATRPDGQCRTA